MEVKHKGKKGSDITHVVGNDHLLAARKYLEDHGFSDEWEAVVADDCSLFLDYDATEGFAPFLSEQFFRVLGILGQMPNQIVCPQYETYVSKGGNTHVVVHLSSPMSMIERIAWQAAFGSDPKREALHLLSVAVGEQNPILLFMRKKQKALVDNLPTLLLGDGDDTSQSV